ncbi:hypothetical protein ACP4J4_02715 [Aureimonas ureilytica]|uniref:hypothetical protein n=1 Tax=Aureimonas ureilytica TaxID=401562 RepID=UPI003CF914D8
MTERSTSKVGTTVAGSDVKALRDILDRLAGTPLERTGDITIEVGGKRYVVSEQRDGTHHAALIDRS